LETYLNYAPRGFGSFLTAMPVWIKEKLYVRAVDANLYYFHGGDNHRNDAGQVNLAQLLSDLIKQRQLLDYTGS
jgi:hypothetical protein